MNKNKKDTIHNPKQPNPLFPQSLIGAHLKDINLTDPLVNTSHYQSLRDYIKTQNPDYFIQAIKLNPDLIAQFYEGKGRKLDVEEYINSSRNDKESKKIVDDNTVVLQTLKHWREIHNWMGDNEEAQLAKKYLDKIAPVLVLPRVERIVYESDEYFKHVTPKVKGEHPYLTYKSPKLFMKRWNNVRQAFEETKSKKRYMLGDHHVKKADAIKAIHKLGNELYDDEVQYLDLTNNNTKTASYIRLVHENNCGICSKHLLSDRTILRLLAKTKKVIQQ